MEYGVAIIWTVGIALIFAVMWFFERTKRKDCVERYTEFDTDECCQAPEKLEPKEEK